jgi:sigma-B regulation protein RsbU (phosphoserine phosphatase)
MRQFEPGEVLLRQDEQGNRYFVILDGEVEIVKAHGTSDERILGVRSQGAFLGEMSLFVKDGRHTASVIARTPLKTLEMSHADLDALLHRYPAFAYEIIRTLSRRLDESEDQTIRDLREKNRALEAALRDLRAAQAGLVEKERLEKELEVARDIQRSILPAELPRSGLAEFGARLESMAAVGGDFYEVMPLDDQRVAIVVGDVSGHGVPAALLMAQTATLIRVIGERHVSPIEALRIVNSYLLRANESGMFVTLLFGIYDASRAELIYARAGHELPLIFHPRIDEIAPDRTIGQPLGLFEDVQIDEQKVALESGSLVVLYTDGVTESLDPGGRLFGQDRLYETVAAMASNEPQLICDEVFERLAQFREGGPVIDDVTILAARVGARLNG